MSVSAACAIGALLLQLPQFRPSSTPTAIETVRSAVDDYAHAGLGHFASQFARARPVNVFVACPDLLAKLPEGLAAATPQDRVDAGRPLPPPGGPPLRSIFVRTADAPVVSADGRHALVLLTYTCPALCGGGSMISFACEHGRWRLDGVETPLWVS